MADESALLPQSVLHVQEDKDLVIPDDANFAPFADVVDMYDWSSDVPLNTRYGVGNFNAKKFDRGQESHAFTVDFPLQGLIAEDDIAGTGDVNAEPVYEAIVRLANRMLERRTIVWKVQHPGDGIEDAGRDVYVIARHCLPDVLTLSGDPEENTPLTCSLEYASPKIRPYTLDQPGTASILTVNSTEDEGGDVTIEGLDDTDSTLTETVTVATGTGTTIGSFKEIYGVWCDDEFAGDITIESSVPNTLLTLYGSATYWDVEMDRGIPILPTTGSRVAGHGGIEQKFLNNTITFDSKAISAEYNSIELEINNNVDTKAGAGRLGLEHRAGIREITLSATIGGQKPANVQASNILRKVTAELVWELDQNTLTMPNSVVSDPGSKVFDSEEAFAMVDTVLTPKDITIT